MKEGVLSGSQGSGPLWGSTRLLVWGGREVGQLGRRRVEAVIRRWGIPGCLSRESSTVLDCKSDFAGELYLQFEGVYAHTQLETSHCDNKYYTHRLMNAHPAETTSTYLSFQRSFSTNH